MSGPRLSIIPARAATDPALKPRDLQVLCVLGRHTDDLGWCRKSQVKMADEMGCARSTVFDAVERLVKAGYLERYVQESDNGRDSPHVYRVILDPKHPDPASVAADDSDAADPCRQVGTPADISAPPAGPEPAPPAGPEPAPKNDPIRTTDSERIEREARARGSEDRKKPDRDFERIWHAWPWQDTGDRDTAFAAWLALDPDARTAAKDRVARWTAGYKASGKDHLPAVSKYLSQRRWADMPEPEAEPAQPAYAKAFSPVWIVRRTCRLIAGPTVQIPLKDWERTAIAEGRLDATELNRGNRMRRGFPEVNAMDSMAVERGAGFSAPTPDEERLAKLCEFVPVDTEVWEAWRRHFDGQGWPWPPHGPRGGFFPAGGPERLSEFEAAIRSEDDAGGREAAE